MFNNKAEEEADFCEAYKSQILDVKTDEQSSPFSSFIKIITILILLVIIIAMSIYSYNYLTNAAQTDAVALPPVSVQTIDDDELKVTLEETPSDVEKKEDKIKELDIDKMANDVKIAIAQNEEESNKTTDTKVKKETETLQVPTGDAEAAYIEELAKLTKELDKERE